MADNSTLIDWLPGPEEHDYPAAASYLTLMYPPSIVSKVVERFHTAPIEQFKAKDIFRASRLSLLGISNTHIKRVQKKIRKGIPISPLLLVRDSANSYVIVADGYHRLCAVYTFDEDAWIPSKIVDL